VCDVGSINLKILLIAWCLLMPGYYGFSDDSCDLDQLNKYLNDRRQVVDSVKLVEQLNLLKLKHLKSSNFYCWLSISLNFADKYFQLSNYGWHIDELTSIIKNPFFEKKINSNNLTKNEATLLCKAFGKRAWYYYELSEYNLAKSDLENIENIHLSNNLSIENFDLSEYCYKSLSTIYTMLGDNRHAITTIFQALNIIEKYNSLPGNKRYNIDLEVDHYKNLARAYNYYSKFDSSLFWIEKGLEKEPSKRNYYDLLLLQLEVLIIKVRKEHYYNANKTFSNSKGLFLFDEIESKLSGIFQNLDDEQKAEYAYVMANRNILTKPPNLQQVSFWYKQRLKFSKKIYGLKTREIAKNHGYVGNSYLDLHQTDSAKHHFNLGLKTILPKFNPKQNPLPNKDLFFNENGIFENLEGLAEVFTLQDSLELALQAYELAFYVKLNLRSIYDFESSKLYLQQKAKEVNSKAIKVAWQLYLRTNDEQYIQRAFKIAESSRALVLLENIAKNQLLRQSENSDSLFAEQKAKFDQPISIAKLQTHLRKSETLIEYFQADSILYAFKIEKNTPPELYQLKPNLLQLDQLLEILRKPDNSENAVTPFKNLAHRVYADIVAPLQIPTGKKIIIIPDGQFNFLPFEVLLKDTIGNLKTLPYLLKDHVINYQYSATIFTRLQKHHNQAQLNKILSIAPVFEGTDYELDESEDEIRELANIFPTDSFMRELATKENVLNKIDLYNILHFSTHASGGDQIANQQAYIVLYDDTLYLNEIYQQPINANLAVLPACETNLGKYEGGEGVMSLSRAFAYAGCPSLVSTLWQANDQSTKKTIVEFYKNLEKGKAKDEALQQAKLHYLKNNEDVHPFYWANLVVIGNTKPIESDQSLAYLINYFWLLFPLCIGTYFLYRSTKRKRHLSKTKKRTSTLQLPVLI